MQGDAEDSTVQGSKNRETELISRKVSRKSKVIQKKKLSDTQCESNINTVTEELASSENIANQLTFGIDIASQIYSDIIVVDDR